MIYVVLNLVMAAFAVGLAFYIDHRSAENVNILLRQCAFTLQFLVLQ